MDKDLKLVDALNEWAHSIDVDGTPSQVGPWPQDLRDIATTITRLHAEIEALKSDVSDLVRAGSDEATENARLVTERDALRVDAQAYADTAKQQREWKEEAEAKVASLDVLLFTARGKALTAEAQRDAALGALKPFAEAWDESGESWMNDADCADEFFMTEGITVAHFRAASRILGKAAS